MFGAIGRGEQIYYTLTEEMNKNLFDLGDYIRSIHLNCLLCSLPLSHLCQRRGTCCASAVSQLCQVLGTVV